MLAALSNTPWLLLGGMTILGAIIGSFLNVVIYRLPKMLEESWKSECCDLLELKAPSDNLSEKLTLSSPRSRCPHCRATITALTNIPILSFVFLQGRCRSCGEKISVRYPLVEGLAAGLGLSSAWLFGIDGFGVLQGSLSSMLMAAFFCWTLLALTFIDLDTHLLPDTLTQPLLWAGLLGAMQNTVNTDLQSAVLGATFGYLSLWLVYWSFKLVTGKEGMGYGDFKLLAALGAWLGWQSLPALILLSSLSGAVIGISMILFGLRSSEEPIPFGPFLAIAGISQLFLSRLNIDLISTSANFL